MIKAPIRSILVFAGGASLLFSTPGYSLTDNERDQMLKEQQTRIQKLEAQLKNTQRSARKTDQTLKDYMSRLKVNGFITAGAARSTTDQEQGDYEWKYLTKISDEWNWKADSVAGIQFTYAIDPKWDATLQLLSRFEDEFRSDADGVITTEWAYLTYRPVDAASVRFGRMRTPLYMFSEYLDVGFAYPWVRPPAETYRVPFTYYDGISVDYVVEMGSWNLLTNVAAGRSDPSVILGLRAEDVGLVNFNLNRDAWTFRIGYTNTTVESDDARLQDLQSAVDGLFRAGRISESYQVLGDGNRAEYISFGGMYDDGTWQIIAEATELHWEDSLVLDGWSNYLTIGHRFGEIMPYITYAHEYTPGDNDRKRHEVIDAADAAIPLLNGLIPDTPPDDETYQEALDRESLIITRDGLTSARNQLAAFIEKQKSLSLGVRWDVSPRVATKFEVSRITGFDEGGNNAGRYDPIAANATADTQVHAPEEGLTSPQYVTSFVINAVF